MYYAMAMLDLGFRTHDFGRKFASAEEIALTAKSYRENACLHFAPYKVLDDTPNPFTVQWAEQTRDALARHGVRVAILGCYINPVHPDPEKLEAELLKFEHGLDVAKALGNVYVATETGSIDPRNIRCEETWSEANWARFLKIVERLLKKAEDNGVTMLFESVADKNTLDTPERMFRVMDTFKSPNLQCLFDAVNIMPIQGVDNYESYYDEAVSMLAPYIKAMHLKDFVWTDSNPNYPYAKGPVKKGMIPIGEGLMPWKTIFGIYKKYNLVDLPMTLENFNPETLSRSLRFVDETWEQA